MRTLFCLTVVIVFVQCGPTLGQRVVGTYDGYNRGGYHHASTAAEGFQRGMADVVRSTGAYNLMTSEAMINVEDARKKNIENRLYGTQTYFEMRRVNKQAREAEQGPRPTQNDVIRYAEQRAPKRLSASEIDPLTGGIAWPSLLQEDVFQAERAKLDELYEARAGRGALTASELMQVSQLISTMESKLLANYVGKVSSLMYTPAKSFLKSLSYESFLPAG